MDENNKETTPEESSVPVENPDAGNKPKPSFLIDRADAANERMEKNFRRDESNLNRREALMVSDRLGGRTEAGQYPPKPEEISSKEYAKNVLSGKHNAKE